MSLKTKLIAISLFLAAGTAGAQGPATTDSAIEASRDYAIRQFDRSLIRESFLYDGFFDNGYAPAIEGSPYYGSDDWNSGNVYYYGRWYNQVPLRYDLVSGNLIILHFNRIFRLRLIKEKVDSFLLGQRLFFHSRDTAGQLPDDFYELLYTGRRQLIASCHRTINEEVSQDGVHRWFSPDQNKFYIRDNREYYRVINRNSMLRYFGKLKGQVKKHLRKRKLKYRKAPRQTLVEALKFFEQLKG